jgi:hypothetical protein
LPDLIERLQVDLKIKEGENEEEEEMLNDKINDSYGIIYAMSNFVSPNIGSFLYENLQLSWPLLCNYIGIMNFLFAIYLFIFNCGPNFLKEDKIF